MTRKAILILSLIILSLLLGTGLASGSAGWVTVDVTSSEVSYYGSGLTNWRRINNKEAINGVEIYSDRDIHEAAFTFEGSAIRWIASVGPNRGMANVYIDDELVAANLDLYAEEGADQVVVFEAVLDAGVHTIKVQPTGTKSEIATFAAITVDAFQYLPTIGKKVAEAYELLRQLPTEAELDDKLFDFPDRAIEALVLAIANAKLADKYFAPGEEGQIAALVALDDAMAKFTGSKIFIARPSLYSFEGNLDDSLGVFPAFSESEVTFEPGVVGQALNLDGNIFVQVPAEHPIANAEEMTVACWVLWREGVHWQRILDFGNNTSQYFFITPASNANTLRFAITSGSGEQTIQTDILPKNEWVHIAVTLGGGVGKLYVNGELKASGNINIVPKDFKPVMNYVGKSQWPDPLFNGLIDELYISNVALSADEIVELMNK
jgi:hypothetical protein